MDQNISISHLTVLAAIANNDSSARVLVQAMLSVKGYASWIQPVPNTGVAEPDSIVLALKQQVLKWYDSIFPAYLELPSLVASADLRIQDDLNLLIQLAQQLAHAPTEAGVRKAIDESAAALAGTVTGIRSNTQSLADQLTAFQRTLDGPAATFPQAKLHLAQAVDSYNDQRARLHGLLHALETATCPDQQRIRECVDTIRLIERDLDRTLRVLELLGEVERRARDASGSLGYLAQRWTEVAKDAGRCTEVLAALRRDPTLALVPVLQDVRGRWAELKTHFDDVSSQLAGT